MFHRALPCLLLLSPLSCSQNDNVKPEVRPTATISAASAPATASQTASATAVARTPARPLYYERALTEEDLRGRSLRELSLMRNTIYARAGNSFRRPWLHRHFSKQPWYKPQKSIDYNKISSLDKANARKVADYDGGLSQADLEKMRDALLARKRAGQIVADDAVELSLLSQRLGSWLGEGGNQDATPLEDHNKLDKILTVESLSTLSRRDLRILRNTIYARRGRPFSSAVVRSYFASANWYKPNNRYGDHMLSGIDQKNIHMIMSVEESLGGPLHENPDYGKDGWFIAA